MKKALIVIFAAIVGLVFLFIRLGGVLDKTFWLAFLPGLLTNLLILAVAVFVIDRIFEKDRWRKLEQINKRQSDFVLFMVNRLAFWLLEYVGLMTQEQAMRDSSLDFDFAIASMKEGHFATSFALKFKTSANQKDFIDGFMGKLNDGTQGISKALDAIYPHADADVHALVDELTHSSGMIGAFGLFDEAISKTNKEVGPDERLKPEQIDVIIKVASPLLANALERISTTLVALSERARANKLFVSLD